MTNTINESSVRCKIKLPSRNRKGKDASELDPFFPTEFVDLLRSDTGEVSGDRYIVNANTRKKLGSVSDGYNLFTHSQASESVKEFLDTTGIKYETLVSETSNSGARFFETIRFPGLEFNASNGLPSTALDNKGLTRDLYTPIMTIRNSYDKSSGISWKYGLFRVVCKNGMAIRSYEQKLSFRHTEILNPNVVRSNLLMNLDRTVSIMEKNYNRLNEAGGNDYLNSLLTSSFSDRFKYLLLEEAKGHYEMDFDIEEDDKGSKTMKIKGINTPLSAYSIWNLATATSTHSITNPSERAMIDEKITKIFQIA